MKTIRLLVLLAALLLAVPSARAATGVKISQITQTNTLAWSNLLYMINATNSYGIIASNFLESIKQIANWNAETTSLVAGVGGALTNVTLMASWTDRYINGFTNVSIRAVMGYTPGRPNYWNVMITNIGGTTRTLEFSQVTNAWRFNGTYGTNAPNTLTNGTGLLLSGRSDGSNTVVGYAYYQWP